MLIELHAHVIYGVDDGPQSREEMFQMLYAAQNSGVTRLFCTSHISPGEAEFPLTVYRKHFQEAQEWCAENAPDLRIYPGTEILYTRQTASMLDGGSIPTLNGTRLVLVEFLPGDSLRHINDALVQLCGGGWQVILAHAERYRALNSLKALAELKDNFGMLVQVNSKSVFDEQAGFFFRRRMRKLLDSGLVDFVSSDAHNTSGRSFCLQYAWRFLQKEYGEGTANQLCGGNFARIARKIEEKD